MFFNEPQFVRGSDGRIYEIHDNDREGGIMFFFLFIFLAIAYAIYSAYLWLVQHYWIVTGVSLVGFITWTGWVYDDFQHKKNYDALGKKIWALVMVLAGLIIATTGFSQAIKGAQLTRSIRGEWVQPDSGITMKITADHFTLTSPNDHVTIDASCSSTYDLAGFVLLKVNGTQYKGSKSTENSTPFAQNYECRIVQDQLSLWANGGALMFQRK